MEDMFTFREDTPGPIHPHRLIYLHASERDRDTVGTVRRFKTEPFEFEETAKQKSRCYVSGSEQQLPQTARTSSQGKIKYFNLDLTKLIQSTSAQSQCISSQKNYQTESKSYEHRKSTGNEENQRCFERISVGREPENKINRVNSKLKYSNIVHGGSREKPKVADISKILDKDLVDELWKAVPLRQSKRINNIQTNCSQFKEKYSKLNPGQLKKNPKIISPSYFKTKAPNRQEIKDELQVKKIEKILMDKHGNEYRITVQKIK